VRPIFVYTRVYQPLAEDVIRELTYQIKWVYQAVIFYTRQPFY